MNRDEILITLCKQFGILDDDGQPLRLDTIRKQLTYNQFVRQFELLADLFDNEIRLAFAKGEKAGLEQGHKITNEVLGGTQNDN